MNEWNVYNGDLKIYKLILVYKGCLIKNVIN